MSGSKIKSVRSRIEAKASELFDELMELIQNPRAAEIIGGMWLYDEDLKTPSQEIIVLLAEAVFRDSALRKELEAAEDVDAGFKIIAAKLAKTEEPKARHLALGYAKRLVMQLLLHPSDEEGARQAIWYTLVEGFLNAESSTDRLICQKAIDLLVGRSLLKRDFNALEALAALTKALKTSSSQRNQAARTIASDILYWEPYLESKLGYTPSKSALKSFILGIYDYQSDRDADWSKAHKILGNHAKVDRSGKRAPAELIANLALEARRLR